MITDGGAVKANNGTDDNLRLESKGAENYIC